MDFDEIYKSIFLSEKTVLSQVDEYTLYCYYTGIDPLYLNKAYHAPYYRKDSVPSFSVFRSTKSTTVEYMWKDHATGESGNIFRLIQCIEQLDNVQQVLARINEDFALGYNEEAPIIKDKIQWYSNPPDNIIKVRIVEQKLTEKGALFWNQFRIGEDLLKLYNTTQVQFYWTYDEQQAPKTALDPTFAYRVGKYYQLYSPYAPRDAKFRNDLPENYFFGYLQLPNTGERLVIDKSSKDVIFCRRLGYDAVAGKSETTMIPHDKMLQLKDRFKEVFLTLDPDPAGRKQTDKYMSMYPWLKPRFLDDLEAKDKTGLCLKYGFDEAERIINQLLR